MKQYVIFLVIALIAATGAGQDKYGNYLNENQITQPRFLGSQSFVNDEIKAESLRDYLNKMVNYPQESMNCYREGTEVVEFIVTAAGEPTAFNILNSVCTEMDIEVIRAIKTTSGKWAPGTMNGKPADMKQEVSVIFTLCSSERYLEKVQRLAKKGTHLLFDLKKPEKAMNCFNCAIVLLPNEVSLLTARSLCRYATGDNSGAENDWKRIKDLAEQDNVVPALEMYADQISKLVGYEEMVKAIN